MRITVVKVLSFIVITEWSLSKVNAFSVMELVAL